MNILGWLQRIRVIEENAALKKIFTLENQQQNIILSEKEKKNARFSFFLFILLRKKILLRLRPLCI